MFQGYTENEIFLSSLICRKNNYLNEKVTIINFLLNLTCKEKVFIDNRNINIDDLREDGLHLIEQGKAKLAGNSIHFLKFLLTTNTQSFSNHSPSIRYEFTHTNS